MKFSKYIPRVTRVYMYLYVCFYSRSHLCVFFITPCNYSIHNDIKKCSTHYYTLLFIRKNFCIGPTINIEGIKCEKDGSKCEREMNFVNEIGDFYVFSLQENIKDVDFCESNSYERYEGLVL